MNKRFYVGRPGRRRAFREDVDPTDSIINIADVMLVFCCGLLLALVMYWNVDIQPQSMVSLEQGAEVSQIDEVQDNIERSEDGGSGYKKMGTVYEDPETGQMYMLSE